MNYEYQPTCQIPPETLDAIYTAAFGVRNTGSLVEIGAHDGWHWSNSWGLAKIGWTAVYAEPVPKLFSECRKTHKDHPNVTVKKCCIGPVNGRVTLGMAEYGASLESKKDQFRCTQYTLDRFLTMTRVRPRFDLLVIDVEGGEQGVLDGFTLFEWYPKLVIIERPPVPNIFLNAGYRPVYTDWINTCYTI